MATTWYAQAAGAIQTIEWDTVPTGSGTDLTWPPAADDVLCANGKALTWAAASVPTLTCARISTAAEGGTAGGGFALSGSTAVAIGTALHPTDLTAGTTACLTSTHTGTGANGVTITGNVTGGSAGNARGAWNNVAGTLTINGAVTGGSGAGAQGAYNNSTGTITITGNVTGGSNTNAHGAQNNAAGTLTITGPVTGGSAANAYGAQNNGAGTLTINGNVTGGSTARAYGAVNNSTGAFTIIGSLIDTEQCSAYAGRLYWQPVAGVHYHKVFHSAGAARYYSPSPADSDVRFGTFAGFSPSGVSYSGILALPAVANVRDGIFYDAYGTQEGTLALPAEADVKLGVGYGTNATEFTGTLAAGGGGVPLIGPGGLVG